MSWRGRASLRFTIRAGDNCGHFFSLSSVVGFGLGVAVVCRVVRREGGGRRDVLCLCGKTLAPQILGTRGLN